MYTGPYQSGKYLQFYDPVSKLVSSHPLLASCYDFFQTQTSSQIWRRDERLHDLWRRLPALERLRSLTM